MGLRWNDLLVLQYEAQHQRQILYTGLLLNHKGNLPGNNV